MRVILKEKLISFMVRSLVLMFTLILIVSVFADNVNADSFNKIVICDKKKFSKIKKRYENDRNVKFFVLDNKFYSKNYLIQEISTSDFNKRKDLLKTADLVFIKLLYGIIEQYQHHKFGPKTGNYLCIQLTSKGLDEYIKDYLNVKLIKKDYLKYLSLKYWTLVIEKPFDKNNMADILNTIAEEVARKYAYYLKNDFIDFISVESMDAPNVPKFKASIYMVIKDAIVINEMCWVTNEAAMCFPSMKGVPDKETYAIMQIYLGYLTPWRGSFRCINGACILDAGVIKMQYPENNPQNFRIDAPWKNAINRQILQELKKRGYKYDIQYDLTAPFLAYLVERASKLPLPEIKLLKRGDYADKIIDMGVHINAALLDGNLTLLNQLIESFIKNKIK